MVELPEDPEELAELTRVKREERDRAILEIQGRKRQRGMDFYIPNAMQMKAHTTEAKTVLVCAGNRCLGGETRIYDPEADKVLRLDQIDGPFHVRAWTGEKLVSAKAHTPFVKGFGPLYRIEFSNGHHLVASGGHRILTPNGFLSVSELRSGSVVSTPTYRQLQCRKISGDFRRSENLSLSSMQSSEWSNHNEGNKTLILRSHKSCYGAFHSLPILRELQEFSSFPQDSNSGIGLLVHEPSDGHLKKKAQGSQSDYHSYSCLSDERFLSEEVSCQSFSPSQGGVPECICDVQYGREHSPIYLSHDHLSIGDGSYHSCNVSPDCLIPPSETSTVKNVIFERNDYYYDLTVPFYHNYQDVSSIISANSGKSTYGAMELCYHLTGNYPDWYPKGRRLRQPIKAVISATTFAMVQRVIEPKLTSLLPLGFYRYKRSPQGYLTRITCKNGSVCDILTLEMGDMAYESADFDFVWEDEPQAKRKREALCRGLIDRNGLEVITFTPLGEPWMKEELLDKADGKNIALFTASTRDNMFDIYGNTILSEESIKRFEDSVSEDYKETRLHGVFFTARGIVYKEFGDAHILDDMKYEYPNPVIAILDPHDRNPHHVIWAYLDRQDDIFVDYEMIVRCELKDLASKMLEVEKRRGYRMKKRFIDPNFGRKPAAAGSNFSVIQELAKHGVKFYEPCDDIELGHMIVRDYIHYDTSKPVTATNKPKLFFSRERVPVTIRSMRNLQYQEWVGKTKEDRNPKEEEKDKDNHGADTVRYLCIERPRYGTSGKLVGELEEAPY